MEKGIGVRHLQVMLLWFCLATNYVHQGSIGMATVIMTEEGQEKSRLVAQWVGAKRFSAFFYGFPVTMILAGYLGPLINNKYCLVFNGFYGTTVSYLTPIILKNYHWNGYYLVRVTQGMVQGIVMPLVYGQMSRWFPPKEFTYLGPITLSGMFAGTFFICAMGGLLGMSKGGIESIFYFSGHCSLVWCLLFVGLGSVDPETCWYIAEEERAYICKSGISKARFHRRVPLRGVLSNLPTYALIITHAAHNWCYHTVARIAPLILFKNFSLPIPTTGLMAGGPFLLLVFAIFPSVYLAHYLLKKNFIDVKTLRFTANSIGQYGIGICLFFMASCDSINTAIIFYFLGFVLASFQLMGFYMNHFDLAPNFVSFLFGWTAGLAHFFSLLGPFIASIVYYSEQDIGWPAVILICGFIYFVGNLVFIMFGSVEIQPYNVTHDLDEEHDDTRDDLA